MKKFLSSLFIICLFAISVQAQTKTDTTQIKSNTNTNVVWVTIPGVGFFPAILGNNLTLQNVGGLWVLNSIQSNQTVTYRNDVTAVPAGGGNSFLSSQVVTNFSSVEVFRNGVNQSDNIDYTITFNNGIATVSFLAQSAPQPGDLVKLRYY